MASLARARVPPCVVLGHLTHYRTFLSLRHDEDISHDGVRRKGIQNHSCASISHKLIVTVLRCNPKIRTSGISAPAFHANTRSLDHLSYRYMGLSDLMKEIKQDPQAFLGDESIELRVLGQVLQLVEDKISEVKNQAVKW